MAKREMTPEDFMDQGVLADVFTEWMTRWREDPGQFEDIVTVLLKTESSEYGERAATYFLWLANELWNEV